MCRGMFPIYIWECGIKVINQVTGMTDCNCNCNLFAVHRSSIGYNPMDIDIVIIHNILQYSTIYPVLGLLVVRY